MGNIKHRSAAFLLKNKLDPNSLDNCFNRLPLKPSNELEYVNKANLKIACIQMELKPYKNLQDFVNHLKDITADAQEKGAQLISFPEYIGLIPLLLSPTFSDLIWDFLYELKHKNYDFCKETLKFFSEELSETLFTCYYNTFALLANQSKLYIHAGSTILNDKGNLYEKCFLFNPNGDVILEQNKIFLSAEEKALGITAGNEIELCNSELGKIAILAGKDCYYYETAKIAKELGAEIILCPINPTTQDDSLSERRAAWARCQEQSLYAVVSRFVGNFFDTKLKGKCAIYSPYDAGKNNYNGIITESKNSETNTVLVKRLNLEYLYLEKDHYHSDYNEIIEEKIISAYKDFPTPLPRLEIK